MSVTPPRVLITGATGGLGRALAFAFCRDGYHVLASARNHDSLAALVMQLQAVGTATGVSCDVTDPHDVRRLAETVDACDTLDVAIVNAGTVARGDFLSPLSSLEAWRDMILVNVFGVAACARAAFPALSRGRGNLFFVGSVTGRAAIRGDLYSVTKHAVSALAESLRLEGCERGVNVAVIQPDLMDTPLVAPERRTRPMMDPADVAAHILSLARSDRPFDVTEVVLRARRADRVRALAPPPAPANEWG